MAHGCGRVLIASIFLIKSSASPQSSQQQYTIGGWISSSQDVMMQKWRPVFETYLTNEVGPLYDPPINFKLVPFDYNTSNSPDAMIAMGQLDFAYTNGGALTCLEAQYGYTELATQAQITLQKQTSASGSVIFSLRSNTDILNISDFAGKRIGVGHPSSAGTFQLGAQYLDSIGLNIYTQFSQVVFYLYDNEALMNDIILGKIDVGMLQSGYLESTFPQNVPLLRYHGLINTSFEAVSYPFPTTTNVVPTYGIAASPNITLDLRQQVADALNRLNKTHPAAKAAGINNFGLPASYEPQRAIVEKLGLLFTTPTGKQRVNIFEGPENFIICPNGYTLERREALFNGCHNADLTCPKGLSCFCTPCHPDYAVTIFPWQTVLGLCMALFITGLCFSVVWVFVLYSGALFIKFFISARRAAATYQGGGNGNGKGTSSMYAAEYDGGVKEVPTIDFA